MMKKKLQRMRRICSDDVGFHIFGEKHRYIHEE